MIPLKHDAVHRLVDYDLVFGGSAVVLVATVGVIYYSYKRVGLPPEVVEDMLFYAILIGFTFPIARGLSHYRVFGSFPVAGLFATGVGLALASFLAPQFQEAYRRKGVPRPKLFGRERASE